LTISKTGLEAISDSIFTVVITLPHFEGPTFSTVKVLRFKGCVLVPRLATFVLSFIIVLRIRVNLPQVNISLAISPVPAEFNENFNSSATIPSRWDERLS